MLLPKLAKPLMKYSYIIIDDDPNSVLRTKAIADGFQMLQYLGTAGDYEAALDLILEVNPTIVFLEINPIDSSSRLSLQLISELYRYLKTVPKIIITTNNPDSAIEAIKYEVLDYFVKPLTASGFRRRYSNLKKLHLQPGLLIPFR
jgi:response regulator of citrate/malate metabolism